MLGWNASDPLYYPGYVLPGGLNDSKIRRSDCVLHADPIPGDGLLPQTGKREAGPSMLANFRDIFHSNSRMGPQTLAWSRERPAQPQFFRRR